MRVQNGDLAPRADVQPVPQVFGGLEVEGVQHQQGQGKVVHPVALVRDLEVGFVLLVHLTQQPVIESSLVL